MQKYLTVETLVINTITDAKEVFPDPKHWARRKALAEALDSGGFSTWEDVKGMLPEKAVTWLEDHKYNEKVYFFGVKSGGNLMRVSRYMGKEEILSKRPDHTGNWRLFRFLKEAEKREGVKLPRGVEEPSLVPHLSCSYITRPEHKKGVRLKTPKPKKCITSEMVLIYGKELMKEGNRIYGMVSSKGVVVEEKPMGFRVGRISYELHVVTPMPAPFLPRSLKPKRKQLIGWVIAEGEGILLKPKGYDDELAQVLIKRAEVISPAGRMLVEGEEKDKNEDFQSEENYETDFDSIMNNSNWSMADEQGLIQLGMMPVPEEHQDENLDGNRINEILSGEEFKDYDKEVWQLKQNLARELGESLTGMRWRYIQYMQSREMVTEGKLKRMLKKGVKIDNRRIISSMTFHKLENMKNKMIEKNPMIGDLMYIYEKYIQGNDARLLLMDENNAFWHPGAEFYSGRNQMSELFFTMNDPREELDDLICHQNYYRSKLEELSFNRKKRDYHAIRRNNRAYWELLCAGKEEQKRKVRKVLQEGSLTHGAVSFVYKDVDQERMDQVRSWYESRLLNASSEEQRIKLMKLYKKAIQNCTENPIMSHRVPVYGETVVTPEVVKFEEVTEKAIKKEDSATMVYAKMVTHMMRNLKAV